MWVGTAGEGVLKYNLRNAQFHFNPELMIDVLKKNHLEMVNIFFQNWAFVSVKHEGDQKICLYNWLTETFYPFQKAKELVGPGKLPGFRTDLSSVHPAYVRQNGDIWTVGADLLELEKMDGNGKAIGKGSIHLPRRSSAIFFEDKQNTLWVGFHNGYLYKLNKAEKGLDSIQYNPEPVPFTDLKVYCDDHEGNLWIGTIQGLIKLNPRTRKITRYYKSDKRLSYNILSLLKDPIKPDKILWIGTEGGGLIQFDKLTSTIRQYTLKDGLPNDVVYGILSDSNHHLWLSTNKGLSRFNPAKNTFTNFTKEDGLQSNEFNRFFYGKFNDGSIWFGGIKGTNLFKPESIINDTTPPKIVFNGFRIFNKEVDYSKAGSTLSQPIEYTSNITLPWDQNMVSIDFAAFDFAAPDLVNYSWKMEGLDKDWIHGGKSRSATYANLSPGKYIFRVKASNNSGYWNKDGISLNITVLPPWWQTWWAYSFYIISFIAIIYGFFRFRLNRLRLQDQLKEEQREAQRLQEVDEIKTRFFSNITHEFRTPLTLILGPTEQLIKKAKDKDEVAELSRIDRNARQLLRLINQLLDLNKLETQNMKLEPSAVDIVSFAKDVLESFVDGAKSKGIQISFYSEINTLNISCDVDKFQKILSNLLSNALKFTLENGSINVSLETIGNHDQMQIQLKVKDTGIGIAEEQQKKIFDRFYQADSSRTRKGEGTGIGLALVKELVELFGGEIQLKSETGKGSEFIVSFPVNVVPEFSENTGNPIRKIDLETTLILNDTGIIEEHPDGETGKPVVLVIDDNADMRNYIKNCLKHIYDVKEAADGAEGIELSFSHIPDLVISDIMMPERDGYEVAEVLKQDERTSHIPLILLTAKSATESRLKGLKTKADAYISKPFNTDELLLNIENMIALRRRLRERYSGDLKTLSEQVVKNKEDKFILKLRSIVEQSIDKVDFSVEDLCLEAHMSRTQLHRKIKVLTDNNTTHFIKRVRLERAFGLLKDGELTVSEIAYTVGFNTPNYFSKCFHEYYGYPPGHVLAK